MKTLLILGILLFSTSVFAQSLVYHRYIEIDSSSRAEDVPSSLLLMDSNSLYLAGYTSKYQVIDPRTREVFYKAFISKINPFNGDTLWERPLNKFTRNPIMQKYNGELISFSSVCGIILDGISYDRITNDGIVQNDTLITATSPHTQLVDAFEIPNKGYCLIGKYNAYELDSATTVIMLDYNLQLKWDRKLTVGTTTECLSAEALTDGKVRVLVRSSTYNLMTITLDSTGRQIGQRIYYYTAPQGFLTFRGVVRDMPNGEQLLVARLASNNFPYATHCQLIKYTADQAVAWTRLDTGDYQLPVVHSDGSIMITGAKYFRKIDNNGNTIYQIQLNTDVFNSGTFIYCAAYDGLGSAYFAGTYYGNRTNIIIYKIAGMGYQYRPSLPTPVREAAQTISLVIWPNPARDALSFSTSGSITLHDLQGQEVLHTSVETGGSVNLSTLSAGMYLVSHRDRNGVITYKKIVKEL